MAGKYAPLKRELLSPLAARQGLSYDLEMLEPGRSPEQNAFHFVSCGSDLLSLFIYKDSFPSDDRKTCRRGAKLMREHFEGDGARRAAIFLAQALAVLLEEMTGRAGHAESAAAHRGFRDLIQEHYPLDAETLARLEACRAEFRVMDTHEVLEDVRLGVRLANAYHLALLDDQGGKDPDSDPELVEIQQSHASRHLKRLAGNTAIEMTLGADLYGSLEEHLFQPGSHRGFIESLSDADWWNDVAGQWRAYGDLALDPRPAAPPLIAPIAQALRERIEELLGPDHQRPLPDHVAEVASTLVNENVDNDVDWNLALDALAMGFRLREAEMEGEGWNDFDPEYTRELVDLSQRDPEIAVGSGALTVRDALPKPFGPTDEVWEELCEWACKEALDRSWARHELKMEDGVGPTLSRSEVEQAFKLGYGLGFSHSVISAAQG